MPKKSEISKGSLTRTTKQEQTKTMRSDRANQKSLRYLSTQPIQEAALAEASIPEQAAPQAAGPINHMEGPIQPRLQQHKLNKLIHQTSNWDNSDPSTIKILGDNIQGSIKYYDGGH